MLWLWLLKCQTAYVRQAPVERRYHCRFHRHCCPGQNAQHQMSAMADDDSGHAAGVATARQHACEYRSQHKMASRSRHRTWSARTSPGGMSTPRTSTQSWWKNTHNPTICPRSGSGEEKAENSHAVMPKGEMERQHHFSKSTDTLDLFKTSQTCWNSSSLWAIHFPILALSDGIITTRTRTRTRTRKRTRSRTRTTAAATTGALDVHHHNHKQQWTEIVKSTDLKYMDVSEDRNISAVSRTSFTSTVSNTLLRDWAQLTLGHFLHQHNIQILHIIFLRVMQLQVSRQFNEQWQSQLLQQQQQQQQLLLLLLTLIAHHAHSRLFYS